MIAVRPELPLPRNPFEPWPAEDIARAVPVPDPVIEAIATGWRCLQFVGAGGMGKSSQLRALEAWLREHGLAARYTYVPRPGQAAATDGTAPEAGWWLVDEAQRWPDGELVQAVTGALGRGCGVVLGSHVDRRRALDRAGVRVRTFRLCGATDDSEVTTLLRRALITSGADPRRFVFPPATRDRLRHHSGGNLRMIMRLCYEIFEDLEAPRAILPGDVEQAVRRLNADAPGLLQWRRRERVERRRERRDLRDRRNGRDR